MYIRPSLQWTLSMNFCIPLNSRLKKLYLDYWTSSEWKLWGVIMSWIFDVLTLTECDTVHAPFLPCIDIDRYILKYYLMSSSPGNLKYICSLAVSGGSSVLIPAPRATPRARLSISKISRRLSLKNRHGLDLQQRELQQFEQPFFCFLLLLGITSSSKSILSKFDILCCC